MIDSLPKLLKPKSLNMSKLFLVIFLPVTVLIAVISALLFYSQSNSQRLITESHERDSIDFNRNELIGGLDSVVSDLMILSENQHIQKFLETKRKDYLREIEKDFLSFCRRKKCYDQIRFLDEKGDEIVRVNFNSGNSYIAPESQLQNKSKRYYFNDTFTLEAGEVFVSPFDLNIEHGKLEKPLKPMIRFGAPIFDKNGQRRGVVLLNYLGARLIAGITRLTDEYQRQIVLLNSEGFWLKGFKPEDEWGFMYENGKDRKFGKVFPDAWGKISETKSGQFHAPEGLFTYATIYPLKEAQRSSTGSGRAFEPSASQLSGQAYNWKIVAWLSPDLLNYERWRILRFLLLFALSVLIVIAIGSWFLAKANLRRKYAEQALLESHNALELRVKERTTELNRANDLLKQEVKEHKQVEEELARERDSLERKVEKRTRELRDSIKQIEETNQRLQEATRAKSTFLSNISHEIRTPMNAILGFSQLMQRDQGLNADQRENLKVINRSGEHLIDLINDVLEISKIEAGRTMLNTGSFDLHTLLADLELMFRGRIETKNLQFEVERTDEAPRYVKTDKIKLRRILINLLGNAVKFTEEGGITLRVAVKREPPEVIRLLIEVEDTGLGISEEEKDKLFGYFEQTKSGMASQGGTGLGLAISREFVRLMGGDITVNSRVGVGSIFSFHICIEEGNADDIEEKRREKRVVGLRPGQPRHRILVVDDKGSNRKLLHKLIAPIGFDVREAANGRVAIDVFNEWRPHLILMDMFMPVMNGYEAVKQIRSTTKGKAVIIIAVTASAFEEDRKTVLSSGVDDFVRKPFKESELFARIGEHLGVEYEYDDADTSGAESGEGAESVLPARESLAGLPAGLVNQMSEATINGDLDILNKLIDQVSDLDSQTAGALRYLANRYEYEQLSELFEPGGAG